MTSLQLMCYV